jgi:hypothetical protein
VKVSGIALTARLVSALAVVLAVSAAIPARAQMINEAAWKPGAQWLSVRFGYAKAQGHDAPNGNVGYGFGYSQMVSKRLSMGGNFEYNLLGKFGGSSLIEMPIVFETLWHFKWKAAVRPYAGGGMGVAYRKVYRSGADTADLQPDIFGSVGANMAIDKAHVLGLDLRVSGVSTDRLEDDPVFGHEKSRSVHWGIKLNYALTY